MFFKFDVNTFSQATKGIAKGSFVMGLMLIGFGMLVFILKDIFAFLAAGLFFLAGFSAIGYSIKVFWAGYKMKRGMGNSPEAYRENVNIHSHDDISN
jgi:hypothetical protein